MTNNEQYVFQNYRLEELVLVSNKAELFFLEFLEFLKSFGYENLYDFISESNVDSLKEVLEIYFSHPFRNVLYDGIARPYTQDKSKWLFICWVLRDAPQQRLQPMLKAISRVDLIIELIIHVAPLFPNQSYWNWPVIREIFIDRLEGSRRALKGGLIENIVRNTLIEIFKEHSMNLTVPNKQISLMNETYDVVVEGSQGSILMPVKSRETMGGGHAHLFTRDINQAIQVAHLNDQICIPVIIAESWIQNIGHLNCEYSVILRINPNQILNNLDRLKEELSLCLPCFRTII